MEQNLNLKNASKLEITNITKLISLNEKEYLIDSSLGKILISGDNLELESLNLESGNLCFKGTIYLIEYIDLKKKSKTVEVKQESFLKKVFK